MSVHELKRPPIADTREWQVSAPKALEQLRHWAQVRPLQPALQDNLRSGGFVRGLSRQDMARDLERI
jgi:HEAT repeat protein